MRCTLFLLQGASSKCELIFGELADGHHACVLEGCSGWRQMPADLHAGINTAVREYCFGFRLCLWLCGPWVLA